MRMETMVVNVMGIFSMLRDGEFFMNYYCAYSILYFIKFQ